MIYDPIAKSYLKVLTEQQLSLNFDAPTESRMISVDGMLKHRYNSANQPIHHTDEGVKNFHRWFGNSTTVDEQGRPKVFYHGTTSTENDSGDTAVTHFNPYYNLKSKQLYGAGVYTTENPDIASEYSSAYRDHAKNDQPNVLSLYVKAEHPLDIDAPIQKSLVHLQKIKGAKTPTGKLKQYIDDYARGGVLPLLNHVSRAYEDETGRYADFDKYQDYAKNTAIDAIHEKVRLGELKTGKDLFNLHAKSYYRGLNETGTHNASTRALRMLGFDSIKHIGGRNLGTIDHPVVIALDSANVKSALGNRGTFNPNRNELSESSEHPMIDVDGELKHRHNSEGKPIHPSDEGIRNFHRWFGNSHTVDGEGRPKVFYHGTGIDFDEFNTTGGGGKTHNTGAFFTDSPHVASTYSKGGRSHNVIPVYVKLHSPVIVDAKGRNWTSITQSAKTLIPTKSGKLKSSTIRTMFKDSWDYPDDTASTDDIAQWSRRNGHHGVIVKNVVDCGSTACVNASDKETEPSTVAIAFDKQQIKSALGNSGQFSTASNKIHEAYLAVTKQHRELSDHPMIDVDGIQRHRHNSEGKPIHSSDEGIKNFHRWFDNSRVTEDRQGSWQNKLQMRPLVLYHGTRYDFDQFRSQGIGNVSHTFGDYETMRHGIFLTPHKEFATQFATQGEHESGQNLMPVYAKMHNYLDIRDGFDDDDIEHLSKHGINEKLMRNIHPSAIWELFDGDDGKHFTDAVKSAGFDGVRMSEDDHDTGEARDVYVAFHPHQIKSALGNSGQFSTTSNKIHEVYLNVR